MPSSTALRASTLLAALDLGSNSFRLEIGRLQRGHIERVDFLKETVRQGNGLSEDGMLSEEAMQRGWDCLARFAERLTAIPCERIRAVATQTLREAQNRDVFLSKAQRILGFPVDVITGREEARLIYQGVSHLLPESSERRLVIDIGGRSTEFMLGQGYAAQRLDSFAVGSVAWSARFFPELLFQASVFRKAQIAASAELEEAAINYHPKDWDIAYGSSGTVGAVADIVRQALGKTYIDQEGLDWAYAQLAACKDMRKLDLPSLKEDRRSVIAGGLAVLFALFSTFGIKQLHPAEGALRHGVLFDMINRSAANTDVRGQSVTALARQFSVDLMQAKRVEHCALHLFAQIGTEEECQNERLLRKLSWAAQLHEIGSFIAHDDYHKHGAYILQHAEAAGFAYVEQENLALLVLGQRGKLKKLPSTWLAPGAALHKLLALRLAVLLCHARTDPDLSGISLKRKNAMLFQLRSSKEWNTNHPQSLYLLEQESALLSKAGITLTVGD